MLPFSTPRLTRRRAFTALALAALGSATGCTKNAGVPETSAADRWPAGTVLAVGDQPLRLEDLEAASRGVAALFPAEVDRAHKRRALKSTLLPRLAVAAAHPTARSKALAEAQQRLDALRANPDLAEDLALKFGNWKELRLEVWAAAQDSLRAAGLDDFAEPENVPPLGALPGAWFGPVETMGEFVIARVESTRPGRTPGDLRLEVRQELFHFLDPDFDITDLREAYADAKLEVIDEEIGDLVSGFYLQQLGQ